MNGSPSDDTKFKLVSIIETFGIPLISLRDKRKHTITLQIYYIIHRHPSSPNFLSWQVFQNLQKICSISLPLKYS